MDMSPFWVINIKSMISAMRICLIDQLGMKLYNMIHQVTRKFLYIWFRFFANNKFLPSQKEVFYRNNILIRMSQLDFHIQTPPLKTTPLSNFDLPILVKLSE